jgi:ComF family protein
LKEAIHLMKFKPVKRLSRPLGALLAEMDLPRVDCVVPVPLSLGGLRQRGFNQALLLSRMVAERIGVPLDTDLLYKKKETPPQVGLSRRARTGNLKGAFGVRRKLDGGRVLLIDDVITTGATAGECSKALLRAGAAEVSVALLARE